ncbi:methyl-accepting chemotaxis protein [Paenibacillus aurantiacus]|uniref:Methyl-accepting chemotaxis protein n=1 Tax=Paenibacillus aurantiacus TaxID=1936118 RepID=A0ABV5KL08_9BACL
MHVIRSLHEITALIPLLKEALPIDVSFAICDREKFIGYWPGERIDLGIRSGQRLNPDEPLARTVRNGLSLKDVVPASFYGYEFVGTAIPLYGEEREIMGGLAVQVRTQAELRGIAEHIADSLSQAQSQLESITSASKELRHFSGQLLNLARQTAGHVGQTEEVVSIVKAVADQTNMLGINASIEAAHAGEKGRGFGIVAGEIRKLSSETVASANTIRGTLQAFRQAMAEMNGSIERMAALAERQSVSSDQIEAFIADIGAMSDRLSQYARRL